VSRYQKGETNLDFIETRDSGWQWHQLGHMQVCISLQTDNHASTPQLKFFTGWMPFLPPNEQHQSTEGKLWRLQNECIKSSEKSVTDLTDKTPCCHPTSVKSLNETQNSDINRGKTPTRLILSSSTTRMLSYWAMLSLHWLSDISTTKRPQIHA